MITNINLKYYAQIGQSLSNEKRLEILLLLMDSRLTVEMLATQTGLSIANTSKHLQVLLKSNLVKNTRYKNYKYYQLINDDIRQKLTNFFDDIENSSVESNFELSNSNNSVKNYSLTIDEVELLLEKGEIVLLDVRPSDEFKNAHIPGAISMPFEELNNLVNSLPRDKTIVAYCSGPNCITSSEAINILEQSGRKAVRLSDEVNI